MAIRHTGSRLVTLGSSILRCTGAQYMRGPSRLSDPQLSSQWSHKLQYTRGCRRRLTLHAVTFTTIHCRPHLFWDNTELRGRVLVIFVRKNVQHFRGLWWGLFFLRLNHKKQCEEIIAISEHLNRQKSGVSQHISKLNVNHISKCDPNFN